MKFGKEMVELVVKLEVNMTLRTINCLFGHITMVLTTGFRENITFLCINGTMDRIQDLYSPIASKLLPM